MNTGVVALEDYEIDPRHHVRDHEGDERRTSQEPAQRSCPGYGGGGAGASAGQPVSKADALSSPRPAALPGSIAAAPWGWLVGDNQAT